ncbi:hypothetical protein diail_4632 [Diaporthe ilicicola]|nr:hypothetical protein diail_4632 [Diaporthe ilicicola]
MAIFVHLSPCISPSYKSGQATTVPDFAASARHHHITHSHNKAADQAHPVACYTSTSKQASLARAVLRIAIAAPHQHPLSKVPSPPIKLARHIEIIDVFMPSARPPRRADSMAVGSSSRQCGVVGCDRKHVCDTVGGVKIYSSYCQEHTCQAPRNESTPFCINPRDPHNRYCAFHGKCRGARGCRSQASRSEKEPFPYICPDHRCAERHCARPRLGHVDVCEAHLTCEIRGCRHRPQPGRRFCHAHLCGMAPGCTRPALQPGAGHCDMHMPCGLVRGCRRLRVRFPDGRQAIHCDVHRPCAKSGHGCRQIASPRSEFCFAHKCSLEGCTSGKESASHYCKQHTCHSSSCHQAKFDIHGRDARYCSAHECAVEKCLHEAKTTGGFCPAHSCAHDSCSANHLPASSYCREHCCHHGGCHHEALHRNGFCRSHSCIERGCKEPRLGGRDHIRQCLSHWTKDVRKNAASEVEYRADYKLFQLEEEIHELEYRERVRQAAEREERRRADEEAQRAEQARQAKIEIERRRLAEHLAKVEEERRRHEEQERFEKKVAARLAEEEAVRAHEAREARRAEREKQRREEEIARVAVERDRMAREDDEARRRAADEMWADELRRERRAREQVEERRRAEEEALRRMRDRDRRGGALDDWW